jgi:integrase
VPGLFREKRYFLDGKPVKAEPDADGKKTVRAALDRLRREGKKVEAVERYHLDLRWKEPKTGKPVRYTERMKEGTLLAAAKMRAREILNAGLAGTFKKVRTDDKRLGEALDDYLKWAKTNRPNTYATRTSLCNVLKKSLGELTKLDDLSAFRIERYKRDREQQDKAKPGTINRSVIMLRHMCRLAVQWGWMSEQAAASVRSVRLLKEPPGRVRFLTPDEESKLLGKLSKGLRAIFQAAILSGMRRAELVELKKSAVDMPHRTITLTKTKSNRVRRVPINDALAAVLETAMKVSACDHVFTDRHGKPYALDTVSRSFKRTALQLGIEDLRFHDCRHDFATKVRRDGHGIDVIKELLGHAQITMSMRYAHVEDELMHNAVKGLKTQPVAASLPDEPKSREENREQSQDAASNS